MSKVSYDGSAGDDLIVREHFDARFTSGTTRVFVSHGAREDASIPVGSSVHTQGVLPDGRLYRTDHVSPNRGEPLTIFITVEDLDLRKH